ncbi:MAG TPA: hypothetical protein VGK97_00065 [Spongiibacteraceae bacterium]|jgi:hypothetical protein
MRKLFILVIVLFAGSVFAELDLSDFDDDLMRTMDDTNKYLEPDINAKNATSAKEGVETIKQGLKWTEDYFSHKGGVDDGVELAQKGQTLSQDILQALDQNDFDKAASSARALTKNCRSCHDLYKPLTK